MRTCVCECVYVCECVLVNECIFGYVLFCLGLKVEQNPV